MIDESNKTNILKRGARRLGNNIGTKLGFSQSAGRQKLQRVTHALFKSYRQYLGSSGAPDSLETLKKYLASVGFDKQTLAKNLDGSTDSVEPAKLASPAPASSQLESDLNSVDHDINEKKTNNELGRDGTYDQIVFYVQKAMQDNKVPKKIQPYLVGK